MVNHSILQNNQNECTIRIAAHAQYSQLLRVQELILDQSITIINLIIEPGAQVTIHDIFCGELHRIDSSEIGEGYLNTLLYINRTVNINIQNGAICTYIYHQNVSAQTILNDTLNIYAQEDAQVNMQMFITGAQESKLTCNFYAQGKRSHINIAGGYVLKDNQKMEIVSLQHHAAQDSISHLYINGIAAHHAQAIYRGLVHIEQQATGVDASQYNKNMLLHETAKVQSIPSLQALNNEVQCAHGSAIGQCDSEQLFYLQSRGLDKKVAQQLMINAFLATPFSENSAVLPIIKNSIEILL